MKIYTSKKFRIAILIIAIIITLTACRQTPAEISSSTEIIEETETIIIDETVSVDRSTSTEKATSIDENTVVEQSVTSKEEVATPEQTHSHPASTPAETLTEETKPSTSHGGSSVKVVQLADPETGISWDGVSPIIYTYPDGTTGTEKRDGATYEQVPGMITTVVTVDKEKYDPHCDHCGKIGGDGTNGTCVRWLMGDVDCPNCGVHVEAQTCHTCKE